METSEQPCLAGVLGSSDGPGECGRGSSLQYLYRLASVFGAAARVLASLHQTVKKHSLPSEAGHGRNGGARDATSTDLSGDACCCGLSYEERKVVCNLRLKNDMLRARPSDLSEEEESIQLIGADVECQGVVVSLMRNSVPHFTMAFENERVAGLWATKLAVACGSSESISKLFSTQRRRIHALEMRTAEAQQSNEEVERCLNFLSREYVEMRYQVRRQVPASPPREVREEEEPLLIEDIDPPKLPSEPEKEPLNSARTGASGGCDLLEEPRKVAPPPCGGTAPCLLGSPSQRKSGREKPKKELPVNLKEAVEPRAEQKAGEETPSLPSPPRRGATGHARSAGQLKKEPLWSPKALSPYDRTSLDRDAGLDRRGHKLAMAHQRHRPKHEPQAAGSIARKTGTSKAADKTSVSEKRP
ncbi:unnamed protein product [Durusdinium trenchii]|uniref:Uncharacterized protein n=1 Tax=Durusdinium trenchii TaxID=1381693 RepID=A0ABP0LM04_9DINO